MKMKQRTRSVLNVVGFLSFVLLSFSVSFGLLIFTSVAVCWLFGIPLGWAVPIGITIMICFALIGALSIEKSNLRSKFPRQLRRIRPEDVQDIVIVVFGTVIPFLLVYAVTRSVLWSSLVAVISFVYFFKIQSFLRAGRSGFKLVPNWHAEQQEAAKELAKQLQSGGKQADQIFCLFLRPLKRIPYEYNPYRDEYIPLEERMAEVVEKYCPVISIGRELPVGPGYIESDDWKRDVVLLMKHAALVLILPDNTPGMRYEIEQIVETEHLAKTLFIAPPANRNTEHWETEWEEITRILENAGLRVPPYDSTGFVFQYSGTGIVPSVNELSGDIRNLNNILRDLFGAERAG